MENSGPLSGPEPLPPVQEQPSAPSPSALRRFFYGPQELRAGWRLLLFLLFFGVSMFFLGWALHPILGKRMSFSMPTIAASEGMFFVSALIASGIMARWEHRSFADYGLPARGAFGGRFWEGALWGFVAISVLLLLLRAAGVFGYGAVTLTGAAILKYGVLWGGVFLLVGFAEEYVFRGYTLFTLSTGIRFWPAALVLATVFGLVHLGNPGESWLGGFEAGFIGLFFCLTLRRTGALWFAIGAHMGWDWGETFFYGVPDSGQMAPGHLFTASFHGSKWLTGGTVGPEGSVVAAGVVAIMFVLFHYRDRVARFPHPETRSRIVPAQRPAA